VPDQPLTPAEGRSLARAGRRVWRRLLVAAVAVLVIAALGWYGYVGYEGSRQIVHGDDVPHGCPTPADMGWSYEAINYDIALDARLPLDNPDWLHDCPNHGAGTAGPEVVSSDGVRVAGWYIPSGDGDPPTAPTVVVVHGWGVSKSDTLRYAATMHDRYNLVLVDLRHAGRSGGEQSTLGVREQDDLRAMLDWLARAKRPSRIAVFGDSGGAATAAKLARTDQRIAALILESPHARIAYALEQRVGRAAPPAYPSVWLVEIGAWLRTGAWPGDADPIDAIPDLGARPLLIIYGAADDTDLPDRNAKLLFETAQAAGVPVEIHVCPGAGHGRVVDTCPTEYKAWVLSFLARVFASP